MFYALAALAAVALIGTITLSAVGATQPDVLQWTVVSIVAAATGGGLVQGAHTTSTKRAAEISAAYQGDDTKRVV
ncbi:MAG: hypothetical protein IVW53_14675 [Chloroflexi bacterium]|nr:hypothetical protein [Chloroflexota bacterium]